MSPGSPAFKLTNQLVFWNDEDQADADINETEDFEEGDIIGEPRETNCNNVTLFEDMLKTVLPYEADLLTADEVNILRRYDSLSYHARYLLIRLCLRKSNKWHRMKSLRKPYGKELGTSIVSAIQELCRNDPSNAGATEVTSQPAIEIEQLAVKVECPDVNIKVEYHDIKLSMDIEDVKPIPGPSSSQSSVLEALPFAEDEMSAELRELLECLDLEELKRIGKHLQVAGLNKFSKDALIRHLLTSSPNQLTLPFSVPASDLKGKSKARQTTLAFPAGLIRHAGETRTKTQADRLRELALKELEKCIRINQQVVEVFRRINLIYFRSPQYAPDLLRPAILVRCKKRAYASYEYKRSQHVWPTREALLAYEQALQLEAQVDSILEGDGLRGARSRSTASKTPGPTSRQSKTPVIPNSKSNHKTEEGATDHHKGNESTESGLSLREQGALQVKAILEQVYPKWQDMIRTQESEPPPPRGLERFESGHVLTRVVCKGAEALGILKEHHAELHVLEALLAQKRWRRGRRGRWHERRALLLMKNKATYTHAMAAVKQALLDDDTHIVFRHKLERRLTSLENRLKVPDIGRHVCQGKLEKASETTIEGIRVHHRLKLDYMNNVLNKSSFTTRVKKHDTGNRLIQTVLPWLQKGSVVSDSHAEAQVQGKSMGKSIWKGRDNEEVNVETLALQHYERMGFKGYHSEGRIITTLFGFLFWDIIFAAIPGAFETPYQAAPLDIVEDTFYYSRQELIEGRLEELRKGLAKEILQAVFDEHVDKETWCVGVRWNIFQKEDLLEIIGCLGGDALAAIGHLMCEDYAGRVGGVPDLIVWNAIAGICKFVEVKGPGDTLRENQKVWIDVLSQAGVPVEVCRVVERDEHSSPAKKTKAKTNNKTQSKKLQIGSKRKRNAFESDHERYSASDDEQEDLDFSQLDVNPSIREAQDHPPTPRRPKRQRKVVNYAEVPFTPSPL